MEIFSHNTMTYLRPQWWLMPIFWTAMCQKRSIYKQYERGVRNFDLRVAFDKKGNVEFRHTIFRYKCKDFDGLVDWLLDHANYVRITLERLRNCSDYALFRSLCKKMEKRGIKLIGGYSRMDNWKVIYACKEDVPEIVERYASKRGSKLDDIFPFAYALLNNKNIMKEFGGTDKLVMMDFC